MATTELLMSIFRGGWLVGDSELSPPTTPASKDSIAASFHLLAQALPLASRSQKFLDFVQESKFHFVYLPNNEGNEECRHQAASAVMVYLKVCTADFFSRYAACTL